jgi:hypothetical protein
MTAAVSVTGYRNVLLPVYYRALSRQPPTPTPAPTPTPTLGETEGGISIWLIIGIAGAVVAIGAAVAVVIIRRRA